MLDTVQQVAATTPPVTVASVEARRPLLAGWAHVAHEPAAVLGLQRCAAAWLSHALDTRMAAEAHARLAGDHLVHGDVRSAHRCCVGERRVLGEGHWACCGQRTVALAAWLPSVPLAGGP